MTLPQPPAGGAPNAQLAAGFGIGIATVCRYIREAIEVPAAHAPTLDEAMVTARTKAYVILDGTVRHEALEDRVGVKGPRHRAVAAVRLKLRTA
ncbi:hypothetical protein ACVW19_006260 [Streptomyces sp. TE5632]